MATVVLADREMPCFLPMQQQEDLKESGVLANDEFLPIEKRVGLMEEQAQWEVE